MARRGGVLTRVCVADACRETTRISYSSKREANELLARDFYKNWKCNRHAQPEKVLSAENTANSVVLIATRRTYKNHRGEERDLGLYWVQEGTEQSGNGFNFSDAHKAYADDFPEGTRLVVTAYVETPEQAAIAAEVDAAVEA
jgi:hypothetical protein